VEPQGSLEPAEARVQVEPQGSLEPAVVRAVRDHQEAQATDSFGKDRGTEVPPMG
jgi:hypothetical protein